jgi:hypothetical protein
MRTIRAADVKGSMELAEQLDPKEWSQIVQRFLTSPRSFGAASKKSCSTSRAAGNRPATGARRRPNPETLRDVICDQVKVLPGVEYDAVLLGLPGRGVIQTWPEVSCWLVE